MKNITCKYSGDDKGIAIMFSLIMLSVFFLISFGFVSMATSHKSSAIAREPEQQATLTADETILNEALFAIEEGLIAGGVPDYSKFRDMVFINNSDTASVTVQAWATQKTTGAGSITQTNLKDALPMQVKDSDDFTPDTDLLDNPEWARVGWITRDLDSTGPDDEYCWMVIESSGIDPNYIGGNTAGTVSGTSSKRYGTYIREIDVGNIDTSFRNDIYVDWTASSPHQAWSDKKTLVTSLSSQIETAISLFEPGTSSITLKEHASSITKFDLTDTNFTTGTAIDFHDKIPWLRNLNSDDSKRLACNIKDYLDEDNIASLIGTDIYGKERVPYINEVLFKITNTTAVSSPDDTVPHPISLNIEATPELVKMITVAPNEWGDGTATSPTGAASTIIIRYNIEAKKTTSDGATINLTDQTMTISQDMSSTTAANIIKGYHQYTTGSVNHTSTGTSTANSILDLDVKITLLDVTFTGNGTDVWDFAKVGEDATTTIEADISKPQYVSFEAADCRNNHTSWLATGFSTSSMTGSMFAMNTNYAGMDGEFSEPFNVSTAYMPENGMIQYLSEIGMISRGQVGQTINLTDYNTTTPNLFSPSNYTHVIVPAPHHLLLDDNSTFNGGDRSLLNFFYIGDSRYLSTPQKNSGFTDLVAYEQFGVINPNTTNRNVLKLLLTDVKPLVGPASSAAAPSGATINFIIDNFPGIEKSSVLGRYFKVDQFHETTGDMHHNRNPERYEYAFSRLHGTPVGVGSLNDAQREALVIHTMNLVSPKYSYFTILSAVNLSSASTVSISAFVRRDNESGSYKILRKSTTP